MTNSTNFNKKIGSRIRDIRKERNLEIEDMIVKLNVSESTYLRIEKGETNSWATYLEKLCKIFEIEEQELLLSKDNLIQINKGKSSGINGSGLVIINQISDITYENIRNDATTIANLKSENKKLIERLEKFENRHVE